MEIILFEKKYSIDVDKIVFELDNQLSKNLEFSPGVSKEDFEKYPKDNKIMFQWLIKKIIVLFLELDKLVIYHSDHLTNLELNIRSIFSDFPISIVDSPDFKNIVPSQYIKEIVRFNDQFVREFQSIFFPEFEKSIYRRIDKLEENSNLSYLKIISDFSNKCIPNYLKDYNSPFFDFLKDSIVIKNLRENFFSLQILIEDKLKFNSFLDDVFVSDLYLTKEQKDHLKLWFHYSKEERRIIEPMYFDKKDDAPYYIALFIKKCGASYSSERNIIEYNYSVNEWLEGNLLLKSNGAPVIKFDQLNSSLKSKRRKSKVENILKKISILK